MIDWNPLSDDWIIRYRTLRLPWNRFLPKDVTPRLDHEGSTEMRTALLPRSERAFLYHAMDATRVVWSGNWHNIMFLDSGKHGRRTRSRWFVPVIATVSEAHPFEELDRLSEALGPVLLQTGVFPSLFVVTHDFREIVRESQNPWWLVTESLAFSWGAHA